MQHSRFGRTALCAAISLASLAAHAEDPTPQEALAPIDNVTIIGRKLDVSDVPGSAHVVEVEELEIFNDTDIMRVLRTVPGVYLQEEEGFGLRPNIGIRGSGLDRSARIALLEDGILIAPAPYAAPSAYYFPTQRRMSSLEVLKGPASVAVGPRTTGGALNMISTPIPDGRGTNIDLRAGEYGTVDVHANTGNRGERVSWLVETVQSQSDGFKRIDGPVGGDTGYDIEDYVAKLQIDSDPSSTVYHSLRLKAGYTEQDSDETYLGLTEEDFAIDPLLRYAASEGDRFTSEHEQIQASYVIDSGKAWGAEVTAYRNDFERNWYKLQSVNGAGMSSVLDDPVTYATELSWLKGATSPDDAIFKRANNRAYYSQGVQAKLDWDLDIGGAEVLLTTGFRLHEDEEDRFQHEDGYRMEDGALPGAVPDRPCPRSRRFADEPRLGRRCAILFHQCRDSRRPLDPDAGPASRGRRTPAPRLLDGRPDACRWADTRAQEFGVDADPGHGRVVQGYGRVASVGRRAPRLQPAGAGQHGRGRVEPQRRARHALRPQRDELRGNLLCQ